MIHVPEKMFYVYEHIRNDTGNVFYVGKGCKKRAYVTDKRSKHWKSIVAKSGGFSVRMTIQNVTEELAFLAEAERIDQLRAIGIRLCNMTDGGEGCSGYVPTVETRKKLSISHIGKVFSHETKEKLSAKKIGNKHMAGKPRDSNTRKKISETMSGKPKPKIQCPHCLLVGGVPMMKRYHFESCKNATDAS
jgi:hypothetical protein